MKEITHLNAKGEAHMVDVSQKNITNRFAKAEGFVHMKLETLHILKSGSAQKGDVLSVSRLAGIMAAKKTSDLIPLCHPLLINHITINFVLSDEPPGLKVEGSVNVSGQTGVEMEALTAVCVSCLTIYDMLKSVDKDMRISNIYLLEKSGGKSGKYTSTLSPKS